MADLLINNPNWQDFASSLEQDRGIAPGLLSSILHVETAGGHPDIINRTSSAGAQGAFQFMPGTAKQYNVNVHDTADSTRGAADFLGDLTKKYGDPLLASAAYNWGPGNVDSAIAKAKAANLPTDALSLAKNGMLPKETSNYVAKVAQTLPGNSAPAQSSQGSAAYSPEVVNSTRNAVVQQVQAGASNASIVEQLVKSPVGDMVTQMLHEGQLPSDIIAQIGGQQLSKLKDIQTKVGNQSFLTNVGQGAGNALTDIGGGAKQLVARITGNDAQLKQLQAEEAARQADPTYQAQGGTVGSMIGSGAVKAVPYIAAAIGSDGASIPLSMAAQGVAGAASAALTPTTGDGQLLKNVAIDTLLGAGTDGLVRGAGAAVPKVIGAAMPKIDQALVDAGHAQGLPVRFMDVSPGWKQIAEGMPTNRSVIAAQEQADAAVTKKIAEGMGVNDYSGPINSDFLNTARKPITDALDSSTNVKVILPDSMKADLQAVLSKTANPLTDGIADSAVVTKAITNLTKAIDGKIAVSGVDLQGLSSELKDLLHNPAISSSQKQVASQLIDKVNNALTTAMSPEQQAAFKLANSQYANLKAVERMVRNTNDSGVVTPRQVLQAAKTGAFKNSFVKGAAPYQDLGTTAASLYGPANGKGIGDIIAKAAGGHDEAMIAASILHPHVGIPTYLIKKAAQAVLGKLATREIAPSSTGLAAKALQSSIAPVADVATAQAAPSVVKVVSESAPAKAAPLMLSYSPKASKAARAIVVDAGGTASIPGEAGLSLKHSLDRNARVDNATIVRALEKTYPGAAQYANMSDKVLNLNLSKKNLSDDVRSAFEAERKARLARAAASLRK